MNIYHAMKNQNNFPSLCSNSILERIKYIGRAYMVKRFFFILLLSIIITSMRASDTTMTSLLPSAFNGWKSSTDRMYDRLGLYEYIDGGAELYISYGFRQMLHRVYVCDNQPSITVDLFDMGSSRNAFGVYTHARQTIDMSYGQGAVVLQGAILFWKDRYYVSIVAENETSESKDAIHELAGHISANIPAEGKIPPVIDRLPKTGLVDESILYFHHYIWVNSYIFIAEENVFGIGEKDQCVLAKYVAGDTRWFVLIIEFTNEPRAKQAFENFRLLEEIEDGFNPCYGEEGGKWMAGLLRDNRLMLIYDSPDRMTAEKILNEIQW